MNRKEAAELLPIIKAYAEGKEIEIFDDTKRKWITAILPNFNCDSSFYRIKPEQKYRPFKDTEECWTEMQKHQPFGWVQDKVSKAFYNIAFLNVKNIYIGTSNISHNYTDILFNFTFADGTPFGIKEEE